LNFGLSTDFSAQL